MKSESRLFGRIWSDLDLNVYINIELLTMIGYAKCIHFTRTHDVFINKTLDEKSSQYLWCPVHMSTVKIFENLPDGKRLEWELFQTSPQL